MKIGYAGAALLAVMSLAACGGGEETKGQPSAEERRALDNIAAKQDAEAAETFDTSADSLVPAEGAEADANAANAADPNAAAPAPSVANSANTVAPQQ